MELYLPSGVKIVVRQFLYFMNEPFQWNAFSLPRFAKPLCHIIFDLKKKEKVKKEKRVDGKKGGNRRSKSSLLRLQLVRVSKKFRSICSGQFASTKWANWANSPVVTRVSFLPLPVSPRFSTTGHSNTFLVDGLVRAEYPMLVKSAYSLNNLWIL